MIKRIALVSFCLALISCSGWRDPVVATVDGEKITAPQLRNQMVIDSDKYDKSLLKNKINFDVFRRQSLDKLTQETSLISEARKIGITITKSELKEIENLKSTTLAAENGDGAIKDRGVDPKMWFDAQKKRLLINKLIEQEVFSKIPVTSESISAYYKKNIRNFRVPTEYHARQILVDSRELADEIMLKIKSGSDFEALAKEYSISPDGKRGGDLGFFNTEMFPEIFSQICAELKPGEISSVAATDYGFQIFQLIDKRPSRQISFEEAAPSIKQKLQEEQSEGAYKKWFNGVKERTKIIINEAAVKEVLLEK